MKCFDSNWNISIFTASYFTKITLFEKQFKIFKKLGKVLMIHFFSDRIKHSVSDGIIFYKITVGILNNKTSFVFQKYLIDIKYRCSLPKTRETVPRHLSSSRAIAHAYATSPGLTWSAYFSFSLFGRHRLRCKNTRSMQVQAM